MIGFKKLTAIILCVILAVSVIPMTAFADERVTPYCEIKLKEGFKTVILPGESVELYLDFDKGEYQSCSFNWDISGGGTNGKYESLGFIKEDGIRITAVSHGTITVKMSLISYNQVIASDEIQITVLDTRTEEEKEQEEKEKRKKEFELLLAETQLLGLFTFTYGVLAPIAAVVLSPYYAYLTIKAIVDWAQGELP